MFLLNPQTRSVLVDNIQPPFVAHLETPPDTFAEDYTVKNRVEIQPDGNQSAIQAPTEAMWDMAEKLIKRHLVGVSKADGSPYKTSVEDVRSMLLSPRGMKVSVAVLRSLYNLEAVDVDEDLLADRPRTEEETDEEASEKLVEFTLGMDAPIVLAAYSWDEGDKVEHHLEFRMRPPTAEQVLAYERARVMIQRGSKRKKRGGQPTSLFQQENAAMVRKVFNSRILSIGGAGYYPDAESAAEGERTAAECVESGIKHWLPLVPYHLVSSAMVMDNALGTEGNG